LETDQFDGCRICRIGGRFNAELVKKQKIVLVECVATYQYLLKDTRGCLFFLNGASPLKSLETHHSVYQFIHLLLNYIAPDKPIREDR
jgi:hypothetical protein